MVRPQVIVSTFVGGVSDGHGQHQVSGEIAQEAFKVADDPKVFPEQLRPVKDGGAGLEPWQPLAVYSRTPFAPITNGQMFDYATGKWAPARFHNYVTGEWIEGSLAGRRDDSGGHVGLGAGPHLRADRARGVGRAEVAEWRRQPCAERARTPRAITCGPSRLRPRRAQSGAGDASLFQQFKGQNRHRLRRPGAAWQAATPPAWLSDGLNKIHIRLRPHSRATAKTKAESTPRTSWRRSTARRSILTRASRRAIWTPKPKPASSSNSARRSRNSRRRSRICSAWTWLPSLPAAAAAKAPEAAAVHRRMKLRAACGPAKSSACTCIYSPASATCA